MTSITKTGTKLVVLVIVATIALLNTGCDPEANTNISISPEANTTANTTPEKAPVDIVEKRGQTTNITDFNELLVRASAIQSYKYNFSDTELGTDEYRVYLLNRFVKIVLPETNKHTTGDVFDEILADRQTKTAFSHCSINTCSRPNIDRQLEKVEYDNYIIKDPYEYISMATNAQYVKEELVEEQYAKVFDATYEGKPARVWVQEYYGFPLKIMVKNEDGSKRTIKFYDVMVDATRSGEIDTPSNFTIKGETGHWLFWKHYLGEWPPKGTQLPVKSGDTLPPAS
jgi:hypothetical protein